MRFPAALALAAVALVAPAASAEEITVGPLTVTYDPNPSGEYQGCSWGPLVGFDGVGFHLDDGSGGIFAETGPLHAGPSIPTICP